MLDGAVDVVSKAGFKRCFCHPGLQVEERLHCKGIAPLANAHFHKIEWGPMAVIWKRSEIAWTLNLGPDSTDLCFFKWRDHPERWDRHHPLGPSEKPLRIAIPNTIPGSTQAYRSICPPRSPRLEEGFSFLLGRSYRLHQEEHGLWGGRMGDCQTGTSSPA